MREDYRMKDFQSRAAQDVHGSGIITYLQIAISHDWIHNRPASLPVSSYMDMIRARINWLPVRAVPGCSSEGEKRCRHCLKSSESAPCETLSHIWGNCEKVHGMRTARHDTVVQLIADKLRRNTEWKVLVEPRDQRNFKPDIVVKNISKSRAWIIDPTIRTETTAEDIEIKNKEKELKYAPTAAELMNEGFKEVTVKGLWIGARGIISHEGKVLLDSLGFNKNDLRDIVCTVLKLSHTMYRMFIQ